MKKIVCLIEDLGSGGAERQLTSLAVLLKQHQYDVEVWTFYPNDFYKSVLDEAQVSYRFISVAQDKIKRIPVLYKQFKRYRPDVVISYLDNSCIIACVIKRLGLNYKLIVSERNTTQNLTFKEKCKFFLYRYADYIVSNSYTQASFIDEHYPQLNSKLHTITNMVDTTVFKPSSKHDFKNEACNIIVVGRVMPQKNTLTFMRAIANVLNKGYNVSVQWYGGYDKDTPQYYQSVVNELSALDLNNKFNLNSATKDIVEKYGESDLFCLPSIYEGFPNVLCEAMSCGLPVVCSSVCDNPTIVENGKNGFLFNPHNIDDISEAIMRFISLSKAQKLEMAHVSREIIETRFSKAEFVERYIELIEK